MLRMEKKKDIPGWYQRLLSVERKPASQIPFKQYCHENENMMKTLCPFLPLDQIRGKLYSQWKKKQPADHKTNYKPGSKTQRRFMHPVVHFLTQKKANSAIQLAEKSVLHLNWLKRTSSGGKGGRTYKRKSFVLSPKVLEVISQSSTVEKSILKGRRAGVDNSGEKRRLPSRVSFTSEAGDSSPSLYSPPTPFVLSPVSQGSRGDQMEEDIPTHGLSQTVPAMESSVNVLNNEMRNFKKPTICAPKKSRMTEHGKSTSAVPLCYLPLTKKDENRDSVVKVHSQKPIPKHREKAIDKTGKKLRKPPRGMPTFPEDDPDFVLPSSQYLEPPKFGTPSHQTPDQDKRFCLFEDELMTMPQPSKETSKNPKKKYPNTRSKHKKYSWSPASCALSQQTPKLNKAKHSFCSQEKPETYNKEKRKKTGVAGKGTNKSVGKAKQQLQIVEGVAERENSSTRKTSQRIHKVMESQTDYTCAQALKHLTTYVSADDKTEDQAICTKDKSELSSKEFKCKQVKTTQKGFAQKQSRHDDRRVSPRTLTAKASKKSESFGQSNEGSHFSETSNSSLRQIMDHQNTKHSLSKIKKGKLQKDKNRDQQKEKPWNLQCCDKEIRKESSKPSPLIHDALQIDSNATAIDEENNYSPEASASGMNVLWNILLQLKNTAASSQNESNLLSSPAQSRLTEFSDMSLKSPSSYAPSPAVQKDLMDFLDPTVAEEFPVMDSLPVMSTASQYRKRGNILCNMFDASDTDSIVSAKMKRNLPNTAEGNFTSEDNFSMLCNDGSLI